MNDIKILTFEIEGIKGPARVYSHSAHDGTDRRIVAFTPIGEAYPVMFLYVANFEAALELARRIGAAHKAGNVDEFIGRWKRECDEAAERVRR